MSTIAGVPGPPSLAGRSSHHSGPQAPGFRCRFADTGSHACAAGAHTRASTKAGVARGLQQRPAPRLYERGPVVNPRASAGRSVAARGGRPTAWTPAELRPDVGCWRPLWTAGGLVVVWSSAHVSIASSSSRTRCYRGSLRRRMSKKDCQAVRREMAPAGAKGLNGWLRVSMYQIASVSLRASSICATFAPRWRPRRRLVRW